MADLEPDDLRGCTAVVTGAARGLGSAIAAKLGERGCAIIACGRDPDRLAAAAQRIRDHSKADVRIVPLDLADANCVSSAAATIRGMTDRIDLLINNGAMWLEGQTGDYSEVEVLGAVNSAVSGTFLLTQGLTPLLSRSARPDVVIIGSTSGLPHAHLQTVAIPFYAAKRAQAALAEGFGQLFRGTPIRSIVVHPPDLDEASPFDNGWANAAHRMKGERATERDVVEAVFYAVTRPRNVTLSITIDADRGGIFG